MSAMRTALAVDGVGVVVLEGVAGDEAPEDTSLDGAFGLEAGG